MCLINSLKHDFDYNIKDSSVTNILSYAESIFIDFIKTCANKDLKMSNNLKFKSYHDTLHHKNDILIFHNISCCNVFEVWKISFDKKYNLNHKIYKHASYTIDNMNDNYFTQFEQLTREVLSHFKNIEYENTVVCQSQYAQDSQSVINFIRNTIFVNKMLNITDKINMNVIDNLNKEYLNEFEMNH
jgi:hypothetical protein